MEAGVSKDKSQLLLLGLQLLNKSLKLRYAPVVSAAAAASVGSDSGGEDSSSSSPRESSLSPAPMVGNVRKRKLPPSPPDESEKREKRKMMNRVAAQNARDRKKSYLQNLESKIAQLEQENKRLQVENATLKNEAMLIRSEKKDLEVKLQANSSNSMVYKEAEEMKCGGSAVPLVSLPQKPTPSLLLLLYHTCLILNLIYWLSCVETLLSVNQTLTIRNAQEYPLSLMELPHSLLRRNQCWWGPHQAGWNPPKN